MKYPPYACQCCGYANADMFYDYWVHKYDRNPTEEEWELFQSYKRAMDELEEARNRVEQLETLLKGRRGRKA